MRHLAHTLILAAIALVFGACASTDYTGAYSAQAKRVLIVVTNAGEMDDGKPTGVWLAEAAHPYHAFERVGWDIVIASPQGGPSPVDQRSMADPDDETLAFADRYVMNGAIWNTVSLGSVEPASFDAIFFAGGHGTMFDFPNERSVKTVAEAIYAQGGVVGAVCHGPAALVQINAPDGTPIVAGRRVTGFTNDEEAAVDLVEEMPFLLETRLREQGGTFVGAPNFQADVVVDGRLVTGQNPASARGTAEAVIEALK